MARRNNHFQSLAQTFRILGDATRLQILRALQEGESNVSTLCQELKIPQPTVSHHLGILKMGGLVSNHRKGKKVFYRLGNFDGQPAKALRAMLR